MGCSPEIISFFSKTVGSAAGVVSLYAVIAFAVRYYRHRHHVGLIGLIGSICAFCGSVGSGVIRLLNDRYLYCDLRLGLYSYLVGEGLGIMFATMHYTMKARVLNVVPGSWTRYQIACMALASITPFFVVPAGTGTNIVEGRIFCQYSVPVHWVAVIAAFIMLNNILPTLAFVQPLIKAWSKIIPRGQSADSASQASLLFQAISGHSGAGDKDDRVEYTKGFTSHDTAHTTLMRKEANRVSGQAKLVRRAFLASCLSCATTLMLLIMIMTEMCGLSFVNNLYAVESANCWFWCVFALPLPQERNAKYDQSWADRTAGIDSKRGWQWWKEKAIYWLNKLII